MSYILDALKRADAERERGAVPGLYARQLTNTPATSTGNAQVRLWLAGAAVVALGVVAAGLWLWRAPVLAVRQANVEPAVTEPKSPAPLTPAVAAAPPAAAAPVPQPVVPVQVPVASAAPAVAPIAPPKPTALPTPSPPPVAKASAAPTAAAAGVALLGELPEELRRQIPPLTITGAVYSDSPGQRLLLVNNQVLAQGSLAAPEVTVEEIGTRSSVFSFRGTRFRLAH